MIKLLNKKRLAIAVLAVVLIIPFYKITEAQEGSVILTWQADNFYPADYKGKPPVTSGSKVYISATLVMDGKLVNSSEKEFIWQVNDRFFNKGTGMDEISFKVDEIEGFIYSISVLIRDGGREYSDSVDIPVGSQELVIENPRPSKFVDLGEEVILEAVPYFFNVGSLDELSFSWRIDNIVEKKQKNSSLTLNIGNSVSLEGTEVLITGVVMNRENPMESANSNLKLKIR